MDAPEMTNDTSNTHGHLITYTKDLFVGCCGTFSRILVFFMPYTYFMICDAQVTLEGFSLDSDDNMYLWPRSIN